MAYSVETAPGLTLDSGPKMRNLVDYLRAGYRSAQAPKKKTASKVATPEKRLARVPGEEIPQMAHGGMVGRTVVEQDDHFHVTDSRGAFRVAKAGLDEATHQKIRGMCSGGEVKGYADGGRVTRNGPSAAELALLDSTFPAPDEPPAGWTAETLPGRGVRAVGHGLASLLDDPTRHEWWDAPGATTPDGAPPPPVADNPAASAATMFPARSEREARMRGQKPAMLAPPAPEGAPAPASPDAPPPGGGGGGIPGLDPRELEMAKAAQTQAGQQEQAAIQQQGAAETAAAQAKAGALKARATEEADLAAQQVRMQADHHQALAAQMTTYQKAVDEFGRATVDPNRYWANASTGQKVLAGIGLLFGAVGAANDGINKSVGIINQAIDRDIDAQKANISVKGRAAEFQRGILSDMRAVFGDDALALQATGDAYRQHAATLMEEMATRTQDPVRQAQLKATAAGLLQSRSQERLAMVAGFQAKAAEIAIAKQKLALARAKAGAGGGGRPITATQQERMAGAKTAFEAAQTIENELIKIGPGVSPSALIPGTRANRFSDKAKSAATVIGKFIENSRFSDADRQFYESLMPGMSDSAVRQKEKIQQLKTLLANKYKAELETMGQAGFNTSGFTGAPTAEPGAPGGAQDEDDE